MWLMMMMMTMMMNDNIDDEDDADKVLWFHAGLSYPRWFLDLRH